MNEKTDNKRVIAIIVGIVIALLAVIAGVIIFSNSPAQRLKKQLSLGERYLSELKYDEAVLAFEEALKIEPRTEAAYIGLANAYIGKEDYESALAAVERGIEAVGETEAFMALKEDIEEQLRPQESEAEQTEDTSEGSAAAKPEVVDWSFDEISDLWQFDIFGKNVNDWTVDDFGQYMIDNGYMNHFDSDLGAWSDVGESYFRADYMLKTSASLCGYEWIWHIHSLPDTEWSLTKPRGLTLDYKDANINLPEELSLLTEKDFIQRLPEELQLGGSFNGGYMHCSEDDKVSYYVFSVHDDHYSYQIEFVKDTGDLEGILSYNSI